MKMKKILFGLGFVGLCVSALGNFDAVSASSVAAENVKNIELKNSDNFNLHEYMSRQLSEFLVKEIFKLVDSNVEKDEENALSETYGEDYSQLKAHADKYYGGSFALMFLCEDEFLEDLFNSLKVSAKKLESAAEKVLSQGVEPFKGVLKAKIAELEEGKAASLLDFTLNNKLNPKFSNSFDCLTKGFKIALANELGLSLSDLDNSAKSISENLQTAVKDCLPDNNESEAEAEGDEAAGIDGEVGSVGEMSNGFAGALVENLDSAEEFKGFGNKE